MAKHYIYIYINYNKANSGYKHGWSSLRVNITQVNPYDSSSKLFKMYNHKIEYPENSYKPSEYSIEIYDPRLYFPHRILKIFNPIFKLVSVDVFFQYNDENNQFPLVIGLNQENVINSSYYTYKDLSEFSFGYFTHKSFQGLLEDKNRFYSSDLLTRLLEERGIYDKSRKKKIAFRLDKKFNHAYPDSGVYEKKITVNKFIYTNNYEKYEHTINSDVNTDFFYLSFEKDSLYIERDGEFQSRSLINISVYYNKASSTTPHYIEFKFHDKRKIYAYSQFKTDLVNEANKAKKISELVDFNPDVDPSTFSQKEIVQIKKEITFRSEGVKNINISEQITPVERDKFITFKFTPITDNSESGSMKGDCEVYNDKLFTRGTNAKIDPSILSEVLDQKFTSISVYYDNIKNNALLVEFVKSSGNIYFKRTRGEHPWQKDMDINKDYSNKLADKLTEIDSIFKPEQGEMSPKGQVGPASKGGDRGETDSNVETKLTAENPTAGDHQASNLTQKSNLSESFEGNIGNHTIIGSLIGVISLLGGSGGGGYWLYKRRSVRSRVLL